MPIPAKTAKAMMASRIVPYCFMMIVPLVGFELMFLAYHLVEVPADAREHFAVAVPHSKEPVDCSVLRCHDVCSCVCVCG
jgi:hypothetical protein